MQKYFLNKKRPHDENHQIPSQEKILHASPYMTWHKIGKNITNGGL